MGTDDTHRREESTERRTGAVDGRGGHQSRGGHVPEFEVHGEDVEADVLIAGFSEFGLAGLTAADYLVDHLELRPEGHVTAPDLPTITPFEEGTPRHPIRIFTREDADVAVLLSELLVPPFGARSFGESLLAWTDAAAIDEVVVLSGIPVAHTEADHRTFYVATGDYQRARLADADVPAMTTGFTDGVKATLLARGIDSPLKVCVYVTPTHPETPDAEGALRLLETVSDVYDLALDLGPLEKFAADVERYYQELADHIERAKAQDPYPDDRMYM
jgi:uncharacterized protein